MSAVGSLRARTYAYWSHHATLSEPILNQFLTAHQFWNDLVAAAWLLRR